MDEETTRHERINGRSARSGSQKNSEAPGAEQQLDGAPNRREQLTAVLGRF
jgi:hypothetical protein